MPEEKRVGTTRRALWRELLWRKPVFAIFLLTTFLSSGSWAWDEFVEPLRHGLPRPKLIQMVRYLPWYVLLIVGLAALAITIAEHALKLIVVAETKTQEAERCIYDGRPIFVLEVATRPIQKGKAWSLISEPDQRDTSGWSRRSLIRASTTCASVKFLLYHPAAKKAFLTP